MKEAGGMLGGIISEIKQLQHNFMQGETDTTINVDPGPAPAGSPLKCSHNEDELDLVIPPGSGGGSGGISFFAIIWNAFITVFTVIFLSAGFSGENALPFAVYLIFIPFWAVGIGFAYAALYQKFGKTHIYLKRNNTGYVEKSLFGWIRKKRFETQTVQSCIMQVAYRSNNVPVYKCVMITPAKKYSFGNKLTNKEKAWICDVINFRLNRFRGDG
jgi:hypothetical protein